MPQPNSSQIHVNTPLSNISIAFLQTQFNFIASRVFPALPVSKQSDRYYVYEKGDFNRDEMQLRAPGTESAGSGYNIDNTPTYFADVWSLHKDIPDQHRANADSVLNLDREATEFLTHKALIRKEKVFAGNFLNTGLWDTDITGVAATPGGGQVLQWNDDASTPLQDIERGINEILSNTGFLPNTFTMGRGVWSQLKNHPDIVDRIKYGTTDKTTASVTLQSLSNLIAEDIPGFRVFVMNAVENTAKEGQTAVHTFINRDRALLSYATPTPGLMTPTAGYDFQWKGLMRGTNFTQMKKFRMELLSADRAEIEMAFDLKLVAPELGFFWNSIVD